MTQQYIEVIQAHLDGKRIEVKRKGGTWQASREPLWNFTDCEYRVAVEPKISDSIDWSHVKPEYRFMARDRIGSARVFISSPAFDDGVWFTGELDEADVEAFASYKRGNMEWHESLVERPKP